MKKWQIFVKSELELSALGIDMTASFAGCRKN
jgi:hypothetical protein